LHLLPSQKSDALLAYKEFKGEAELLNNPFCCGVWVVKLAKHVLTPFVIPQLLDPFASERADRDIGEGIKAMLSVSPLLTNSSMGRSPLSPTYMSGDVWLMFMC
jgi:hypothetical protein